MKEITNSITKARESYMNYTRIILTLLILTSHLKLMADELELETGWLKPELGNKGNVMGASVTSVQDDAKKLTIKIPKNQNPGIEEIKEVIMIGEKTDTVKSPTIRKIKYEFTKDYDNDNYGLKIYLDKRQKMPFRLYLKGQEVDN
ncbi:MAG: hypothetical protein HQL46_05470 [Gammaproteobacteria bacterium]|nr:hypothetical protein [Gammaproteobacteria bacterium]